MDTMQIDILNPKAVKLLKDLADLNLISIREAPGDGFLSLVSRIRDKSKDANLSPEEITEEVKLVRAARYAKSKE
jgi:hypothetical protein